MAGTRAGCHPACKKLPYFTHLPFYISTSAGMADTPLSGKFFLKDFLEQLKIIVLL